MKKRILLLLALVFCFTSLAACRHQDDPRNEPNHASQVYYQLFVRSFADSNGDGIGDFKGIAQNLDYLVDLGVTGIWLLPIHPTDSYHGYDVKDYYAVNPDYGTMEDFEELIVEANKRGIQVILDLVINHTSSKHPWFLEAKSNPDSPYRDYYFWAEPNDYRVGRVNDLGHQVWHRAGDYYFASTFPGDYADLNILNEAVKEEVINIAKFWLEKGVAGFRLDAAMYLFDPNKVPIKYTYRDGILFWNRFRSALREVKPDVYLVGEVWSSYTMYTQYYAGLDATFNFDLSNALIKAVRDNGGAYTTVINRIYREIEKNGGSIAYDAPFLRNHDMNRTATELNGDLDKQKLAAEMLLTLPGTPYIYYGEEIGMYGANTDGTLNVYDETRRLPFVWGDDRIQTRWMDEKCASLGRVLNWDPCHQPIAPARKQIEDENSLYHVYKTMIQLRKDNPALRSDTFIIFDDPNYYKLTLQGFYRYSDEQLLLVLHNLGSSEEELPPFENAKLIYESKRANAYERGKIAPKTTIILELPYRILETLRPEK